MRAYWEDPFGDIEIFDPVREERKAFYRTAAGIIVMRNDIDLQQIKAEQRRLVPYFESLYAAAKHYLADASGADLAASAFTIYSHTVYRAPDAPQKICEMPLEFTGKSVVVSDTGGTSHPLIEQLFPLRPFASLSAEARNAYKVAAQMKTRVPNIDAIKTPPAIRIVVPEIVQQILNWIENIDSPIAAFHYCVRPKERLHVRHQNFGTLAN